MARGRTGLYFLAGPSLFGPRFLYYTWEVPSHWIQFDWNFTVVRVVKYIVKFYFWLAAVGATGAVAEWTRFRRRISIWSFMLPVAGASAFYVALDPSNNNNVFIPTGTLLIVAGILGLNAIVHRLPAVDRWGGYVFALGASFALLVYNPASVVVPREATAAYRDLVSYLRELDGPVYAPWIGQLQDGYQFYPAVHWVPMVDLFRDPTWHLGNSPTTRELLEPVINPRGEAYILMNAPLESDVALNFLAEEYVLDTDFGARFASLSTLPRQIALLWPRYLYRYVAREAVARPPQDGKAGPSRARQ